MNFTASDGATHLADGMAFTVTQPWEVLVSKACRDTYVGTEGSVAQDETTSKVPKLHSCPRVKELETSAVLQYC